MKSAPVIWWIYICVFSIVTKTIAQQPSPTDGRATKSPIRPPKQSAASDITTTATTSSITSSSPSEVPSPVSFELLHSSDHEDFIQSGLNSLSSSSTSNQELFRPIKVATSWYELLTKRFNYIEDASLLYIHHLIDPFDPNVYENLHDLTDPFPVIVGLECSTETNHIYNSIEDIEGFFKFLYVSRLYFATLKVHWKQYTNFTANSAIADFDFDDLSVNRDRPMFDFMMSLSGEIQALELLESRFISILDPPFLFGDLVTDPGFAEVDKEFVREHRLLCVHTHIAAAHDLQELIQFIIENRNKFAKGLCGIEVPDNNAFQSNSNREDGERGGTKKNKKKEEQEEIFEVLRFDDEGNLIDEKGNILESKETKALEREKATAAATKAKEAEEAAKLKNENNVNGNKKNKVKKDKNAWSLRALRQYLSTFQSSPRYKNINQRLYDFMFYHYKEHYVFPFMKNTFCLQIQQEIAFNQTKIHSMKQGSIYLEGEDMEMNVIVTERIEREHVPIEDCLVGVKQTMFIHEERLKESFSDCSIKVRQFYYTNDLEAETQADVIKRPDSEGALTARTLGCFQPKESLSHHQQQEQEEREADFYLEDEEIDEIHHTKSRKHKEEDQSICLPLIDDVADYNIVTLLSMALTSPDALFESLQYAMPNARPSFHHSSIPDPFHLSLPDHQQQTSIGIHQEISPENTVPLVFAKTLVLGFGGGELHNLLLNTFPFMSIESIEISRDVLVMAMKDLGMKYMICEVEEYDLKKKQFFSVYEDVMNEVKGFHKDQDREREKDSERDSQTDYERRARKQESIEESIFAREHYTRVLQYKYYHFEGFYDPTHVDHARLRGLSSSSSSAAGDQALNEENMNRNMNSKSSSSEESSTKRSSSEIYEEYFAHLSESYSEDDFFCRSKVRLLDAWEFVELAYRQILEEESLKKEEWLTQHHSDRSHDVNTIFTGVRYYDYVIFDAYDEKSTFWDGLTFVGESVPRSNQLISSMHKLKHILRPFTGIAVIHLHKDKNFKMQYEKICEIFGSQQVVTFEVANNDAIVVAARDRFTSLTHDEFQYECHTTFNRNGERVENCVRVPLKPTQPLLQKKPLNEGQDSIGGGEKENEEEEEEEDVFENLYLENPRYHFLVHPCGEEEKALLPKELVMLAKRLDFTPRMTLMYLLGLNCDPMRVYNKILAESQYAHEVLQRQQANNETMPSEAPSINKPSIAHILQPTEDEYDDYHDEL